MTNDRAQKIDDLICSGCNDTFIEPRLLPCNKSLCTSCITLIENPNEFKCILCNQIHQIPTNNFTPNDQLTEQLNKLKEFNSTKEVQELKSTLNNIEAELKQTEFDLSNSDYVIKEQCTELRRQVQLAKETKIERINKESDEMIAKIDEFENDRINAFAKDSNSKKQTEIKDKLDKLNETFNQFKTQMIFSEMGSSNCIDSLTIDKKLINELDRAKRMQSFLATDKEYTLSRIFNNKMMDFYQKRDENETIIGKLELSKFDSIDFNKIGKVDMNLYLDDLNDPIHSRNKILVTFSLEENFVILVYKHLGLKMLSFDENKSLKMTKKMNRLDFGEYCYHSNKFCFTYSDFHNKNSKYLCCFNERLELLKQIEVKHLQLLVGCNDSMVFLTSNEVNQAPITAFNWSLEQEKEIEQINESDISFYITSVAKFRIQNGKYYIIQKYNNTLFILDEQNGNLIKSIEFNDIAYFDIDSDDRLVVIDGVHDLLIYYNPNGDLLKEVKLLNFPSKNDTFWSIDSDNLNIFDKENYWLSIKKLKY